ncbi:MAG: hypothetical protein DMG74_01530 [Acidobacteria bacterium]|nr:MAG: hypothetical protein DMG74_01530 [Acidobacteriota bacterium]
MTSQADKKWGSTVPMSIFTVCVLCGACLFLIPAFIIRPFRYQSSRALAIALGVKQIAPRWTMVAVALTVILAVVLWKRVSRWQRVFFVAGLLLIAFSATMARINYFEWMFHPVAIPGFEPAVSATLDASEMVMAVRLGTDSRAYPIRELAYHHVVNDTVGGVPIAVTY